MVSCHPNYGGGRREDRGGGGGVGQFRGPGKGMDSVGAEGMDIGGQFEGEGDGQFRGPGRVDRGRGSLI